MYVVVEAGGRQYKMTEGQTVRVQKLAVAEGQTVTFDKVLLVSDGQEIRVGQPWISGASVQAKVLEQGRGRKVNILKFKRRKHQMKRAGHRQAYTDVTITSIQQ